MERRIFIGDIHGDINELERIIDELRVSEEDEVIFLGDYVDRGENTKEVLDKLITFKEEFPKTRFLWGNHELVMYQWLEESSPAYVDTIEGLKTVRNLVGDESIYARMGNIYKEIEGEMRVVTFEVKEKIRERYGDFFKGLEYHVEYDEHVAVHGGLNFATEEPIRDTTDRGKLYIRGFLEGSPLDKVMIIGHTSFNEITITSDEKVIAVDTGCGMGGKLSALVYIKGLDFYVNEQGKEIEKIK